MRFLLTILIGFNIWSANAQINVGQWRDHLPYSSCKKVVQIGSKIYCATDLNIFTYDLKDNSIQKLSRITGLSDIGVGAMEYNPDHNILLIAYENGNIDLLKGKQVINFPDILHASVTGSKKANHIFFRNQFAYISYSFGILVLDLDRMEVKDTYQVGEMGQMYNVLSLTADDSYFYAATEKGLFRAEIDDPFLVEYSRWKRMTSIPSNAGRFDLLENINGRIIANYSGSGGQSDTLYYLDGNDWHKVPNQQYEINQEIRKSGNNLLVSNSHAVYLLNDQFKKEWLINDYGFYTSEPSGSLLDETGDLWIADKVSGLILKRPSSGVYEKIQPNGPFREFAYQMFFDKGTLYVTGGGVTESWNNLPIVGMYYKFKDENWNSFVNWDVLDYTAIAVHPDDPSDVYVGAWGSGVWNYKDDQKSVNYTEQNSTLQNNIPGKEYVRISGLCFDKDKNLWVTNSGVSAPISVRKKDGSWKSFDWGTYINCTAIGTISQDRNGCFWVYLPYSTGLFVFDVNGTIDNDKDDRYLRFKPQTAGGDIINNVYCVTHDLDGNVWVGTDKGPVVYTNPEDIFKGETAGSQILIPRNERTDTADILLGTETINCITVDGANRKWFGTERSGAYLFTPDGTKQIYHFSMDNSPIFSNTIRSIAINDQTGEVFFGTDKGIISFRGNATAGNEDYSKVYVFPNPVRENYDGPITITGLIENTTVKITDVSGNLVYQTKSLGGQAVWDGRTHGGRKVATGIYLVFCSNEDATQTFVTKMLVIH